MTKRFQRMKRSRVQLTARDHRTVEAVFEARYMTNRQIARLLYKPTTFSWCKQRNRYLYDLGCLKKRKVYLNEPDIYFVGLQGKRYIVSLGEYTKEQVDKIAGVSGGRESSPHIMMRHELTLSRLYVNARLECARHGWSLRWSNTRMLELEALGVEPDARIEIGDGERSKAAFLEFTAAMPSADELRGKIARYEAYWERTKQPTAVLWLASSRAKVNRLRDGTAKSLYKDYFLHGSIEDARSFLTEAVWWWSESEDQVCFVSPPP